PAVGLHASVWLVKGSKDTAELVVLAVPRPQVKVKTFDNRTFPPPKPEPPVKPRKPRDPGPVAAFVDRELDRELARRKLRSSAQADDAEFLRRVTLDLTGRIPTLRRTLAFLESRDPHKRTRLVDELLAAPEYGAHFGTLWRNRIEARV